MRSSTMILAFGVLLLVPQAAATQTTPEAAAVGVCAIIDGQLREIAATYDAASGDTIVSGQPMAEAYPVTSPPYLAGADWYARDEMVEFEQRRYLRYGTPRVVRTDLLTKVGEFRGIPLFAESRGAAFRIVYALVDTSCAFQPYWYAATVGAVRGD